QALYVIIDEYDNFTNTILTNSGEGAYRNLSRGEGFFRTFFNVLKAGTGGIEASIKRLFITGVSPVTMDDVTSGFNIGKQVSRNLKLNRMLGFTSADVTEMIEYYRSKGKITTGVAHLMEIMTQWYGNYRFSEDDEIRLFNSDMVLYFLDNYMERQNLFEELIDRNVRIDYGKLRHLIIVDRDSAGKATKPEVNGNFSRLRE
ncbi:MAG: AAA family ATPase, partial [bacterium]|nr:AAA family ATPase [bacterium]